VKIVQLSDKVAVSAAIVILLLGFIFNAGFSMKEDAELEARISALEDNNSASAKEFLRDRIVRAIGEESSFVVSGLSSELAMWESIYPSKLSMLSTDDASALCTFKWEIMGGLRSSGDLDDFLSKDMPNDTADRDARALIAGLSVLPTGPVAMNCEAALKDYLNAEPDDLVWAEALANPLPYVKAMDPLGERAGSVELDRFCLESTLDNLRSKIGRHEGYPSGTDELAFVLYDKWFDQCDR
jgi:hypothetical protein